MKTGITLGFLLCTLLSFSQKDGYKFVKITPADLEKKAYSIDSSANAVYLADVGSSEIVGNSKGWFSFKFKRHTRVHILNKNGYHEATIEIPLYTNGTYIEKIENLKAVTYNLENGKVVETRFNKEDLFSEKHSKNLTISKFTMPNVKEGSIIDFEYQILSDYLQYLQPWSFQGSSPRLWSDYTVSIPQFFQYNLVGQGYTKFHIKDQKDRVNQFYIYQPVETGGSETFNLRCGVTDYRWVNKDVPALKEEGYTSSLKNYVSRIEFQLAGLREPLTHKNLMDSWEGVTGELLKDEDFGKSLDEANNWMSDILKPLLANTPTPMEKAQRIFEYLRDNTTCTNYNAVYIAQPLRNVLKTKNGKVSEINLLLAAMLKHAGIEANPVILSTRENGFVYTKYPMISRFNYVICAAKIGDQTYYLDASHAQLGFGKLLPNCYNGYARTISPEPGAVVLSSESLQERKVTSISISNTDKGSWSGKMQQSLGFFESYSTRKKVREQGKEEFFKDIRKKYNFDMDIKNPTLDSLPLLEHPIGIKYDFTINTNDEDILYVNPMFAEAYKENPFKSAERAYPVEMPYTFDETFVLNMEIPSGYSLDELPKPATVKLNERGDCQFEYVLAQNGNSISLRSRIQFKKATFTPSEYNALRDFFNLIVSKQSEQIVFKKIK